MLVLFNFKLASNVLFLAFLLKNLISKFSRDKKKTINTKPMKYLCQSPGYLNVVLYFNNSSPASIKNGII